VYTLSQVFFEKHVQNLNTPQNNSVTWDLQMRFNSAFKGLNRQHKNVSGSVCLLFSLNNIYKTISRQDSTIKPIAKIVKLNGTSAQLFLLHKVICRLHVSINK